ncbi:MAG: hypothetical protein IKJ77_03475 [Firmicutes bacterium]|nr:hypothetical protein [Bacillota bacterium]
MLENKKLNMIISLLIAIALWAFVIGEVNPEATRLYREVPIQFTNQEALENSNMAVYSVSDRTMNVTLTGTRSEINKIDIKDISATVDLSEAAMGENQLRIQLKVSSKVEIESQSIDRVTVTVENRAAKEIPVEIIYEGEFNGEEEPITAEQSRNTVIVYGAETTVGQVAAARGRVDGALVQAHSQELECSLFAANAAGQRVYNVTLSQESIFVTAELAKLKTVPLIVPIEGGDGDGIERTVTTPEEIILKGRTVDLESIESITTEELFLDDVWSNTVIPLEPILPEGVEVSVENDSLEAVVEVAKRGTKALRFDQSKIEMENLADSLSAEIQDVTIDAAVSGGETLLSGITEDSVRLFVDLSGFKVGKHKVNLQAVCNVDGTAINVTPKKVTILIKNDKTDTDQPVDGGDGQDNKDNNDNNHESEE